MIRDPDTGALANCEISAVSFEGLSIKTADGQPATLAVIDKDGNIVEAGPSVVRQAWDVSITSYRNFLMGSGHLRVLSKPPERPKQ
ncbi:hypothetical protein [Paraburkholderia dipogonis]|uniref:hypothetical protein n=1 Tax=Paraburkholderia dipogonis TaxID=1211383 RepID=UPI0038B90781